MATSNGLGEFGKRMFTVADKMELNTSQMIRKVALVAGQSIVTRTPKDTGRAQGNWQMSVDRSTNTIKETIQTPAEVLAQHAGTVSGFSIESNRGIYINNNLPYISKLNNGSSKQAPAGFVEMGIRDGILAVATEKLIK